MNKIITYITFLLLMAGSCFSQQLISTAGLQQNNVSWSIGELVTSEGSVSQLLVGQGFNSMSDTILVSGLSNVTLSAILVYPNPVVDKLYIKQTDGEPYSFILTDIVGRVLINKTGDTNQEIDLSHYAIGQYILKITTSKFSKSTILIKK